MTTSVARTLLVSGIAAGLFAGLPGCSFSIGSGDVKKSDVVGQITAKMTDADGNKPETVTCPDALKAEVGAQTNCQMKVKDKPYNVNVTVTQIKGDSVNFDMVETLDKAAVASGISDQITQQFHKPDSVTCPDNLKGAKGATLRCEIKDDGQAHGVTVTVTDVQGGDVLYDFKVDEQPK
ncbi:DUF4333 domain-containing protein [Mycobacteroides sp. LB1]|uniref:DUF4333 domain-containing protein n=1 Tax=Mycobacteroides sp. LB1 TaxID=2750814 RepID=UPI0015DE0C58|nr:DUF4333 domain-containing protein [Mycobacteroides sp. LB1]